MSDFILFRFRMDVCVIWINMIAQMYNNRLIYAMGTRGQASADVYYLAGD